MVEEFIVEDSIGKPKSKDACEKFKSLRGADGSAAISRSNVEPKTKYKYPHSGGMYTPQTEREIKREEEQTRA